MTLKPQYTGNELRRRLQAYDRTPFLDLLAIMLECAPTAQDFEKFAKKAPEKYISAITQLARTAGFTDRTEQTYNVNLNIGQMSDSQLEDRNRQLAAQLQLPAPYIDLVADEVHVVAGEVREVIPPAPPGAKTDEVRRVWTKKRDRAPRTPR